MQRAFVAGGRSGPAPAASRSSRAAFTPSGSNSFETGTAHTLGVSLAVTGSLKVQSLATDPVVELRVTGSQNQSIDCDPAIPNLRDEINEGCGPAYKINKTLACPAYNALWSLPEPWECVKTQTGGSVGQVEHGLKDRILGGCELVHRSDQLAELQLGRPADRAAHHHAVRHASAARATTSSR